VVIREYQDGVLLREDAISQEVLEPIFGPMAQAVKKRRIRKAKTKVRNYTGVQLAPDNTKLDTALCLKQACVCSELSSCAAPCHASHGLPC